MKPFLTLVGIGVGGLVLFVLLIGLAAAVFQPKHPAQAASAPPPVKGCVESHHDFVPTSANGVFIDMHVTNNCQVPVNLYLEMGLFRRTNGEQTVAWEYDGFTDLLPGHSYVQAFTDHEYDKFLVEFRVKPSSHYDEIGCQKNDTPDQCKTVLACEREQSVELCEKGYGAASTEAQNGGVSTPPSIGSDGRP